MRERDPIRGHLTTDQKVGSSSLSGRVSRTLSETTI